MLERDQSASSTDVLRSHPVRDASAMDGGDRRDRRHSTELRDDAASRFHVAIVANIATSASPVVAISARDGLCGFRYPYRMQGEWLKSALKHAGINQAELARRMTEKLGRVIDRSMVNKAVLGKRDLSAEEFLAIEQITEFRREGEFAHGLDSELRYVPDEPPPDPYEDGPGEPDDRPPTHSTKTGSRGIPPDTIAEMDVDAGLGAGGFSLVSQDTDGRMTFAAEVIRDYWRVPEWFTRSLGTQTKYVFAFKAEGDSMAPRIMSGDVVFIDTRRRVPSPDGLYALVDIFGGVVIKRLTVIAPHSTDDPVRVRISSDNPAHGEQVRALDEITIIGRFLSRMTEY